MATIRLAVVASLVRSYGAAFTPSSKSAIGRFPNRLQTASIAIARHGQVRRSDTRRFFSFDPSDVQITRVGREQMEEIFEDIENGGSDYVVMDVRGDDEIAATGKISKHAHTLPLPLIAQRGAFNMDDDDFEEAFGFSKPMPDQTLVFTCKAGIRSYHAAQFAAMSGYTNLVDYMGGANEWFAY